MLDELARAFASLPVLYSPRRSEFLSMENGEASRQLNLVALSEQVLGRNSPERIALLIRALRLGRPCVGASIREKVREGAWRGSRSSLYRRSRRGARLLAKHLNSNFPVASGTTFVGG